MIRNLEFDFLKSQVKLNKGSTILDMGFEQLKEENGNLKRELAKMKKLNSELEKKAKKEIENLESILKEEKERNRRENEKQKSEIERLRRELGEDRRRNQTVAKKEEKRDEVKNGELEKLRMELDAIGGAGEYFGNDNETGWGGKRDEMKEEELRKVLKLLALGETTINIKEREFLIFKAKNNFEKLSDKFHDSNNWEVAEAGWHLEFKSADEWKRGDGWFYLSIWKKGKK